MAGICYYNIEEIPNIPEDTKLITLGTILAISREEKFLTFNISDSTSTAQATFYERKSEYEMMKIPQVGDTIEVLGTCSTKPFANDKLKLFLKIRIDRWRTLTFTQQVDILQRIINSRKIRFQKKKEEEAVVLKKKVRIKDKIFTQKQMVDIRSLVLSYMYIVFESNNDIQSYIFYPHMVIKHKISKQYAQSNKIPERSFLEAVNRALVYLVAHEVIQSKSQMGQTTSGPEQYVIKKRYFERLVVQIEQFIFDKKATGSTLQQVTMALNDKMGKHNDEQYVFNFKFIQKILMGLINQNRIYKTSDKKLYPNNY